MTVEIHMHSKYEGTGEMSQWVRHLLHKHEDPNVVPGTT